MSHLDDVTRLMPCSYLHYLPCDTENISCVPKHKCFCISLLLGERQMIRNVLPLVDLLFHHGHQSALEVSVDQGTCSEVELAIPRLHLHNCTGRCSHAVEAGRLGWDSSWEQSKSLSCGRLAWRRPLLLLAWLKVQPNQTSFTLGLPKHSLCGTKRHLSSKWHELLANKQS